jgi:RNA polymerase sigma factor (TIGR02999 family)
VTALLVKAKEGDAAAHEQLLPLVYGELRRLAASAMRREAAHHTLQPTALVHEAFLRLFHGAVPDYTNRAHFLGIAARVMRQVLVDYARVRRSQKRDAHLTIPIEDNIAAQAEKGDVLVLNEALDKLGVEDERLVALVEMRFFAGMTAEEIAEARVESVHVVRHDLRYAMARLRTFASGQATQR